MIRGVRKVIVPVDDQERAKEMPFGWWALFEDQEGTRYALGQWS